MQLAQLLRTRGESAPHGRMVRHTSNNYKGRLKPVSAVRKSQAGTVRQPKPDGPGPVNLKCQSTDHIEQHGRTVRPSLPYGLPLGVSTVPAKALDGL